MNRKVVVKILVISLFLILIVLAGYFIFLKKMPNTSLAPSVAFLQALQTAPEEIEIGGSEYGLEAYLWRDLIPSMSLSDGSLLIAVIRVKALGENVRAFWDRGN